jgi:hypothetical protein
MRNFHRRIMKLEGIDAASIGTQFAITDTPYGEPCAVGRDARYSIRETEMSVDEWAAIYCRQDLH